jgi:hypothetical protein
MIGSTVIGTLAVTSTMGVVGTFLIGRFSLPRVEGSYENSDWPSVVDTLQSVHYKLALVALVAISIFAGLEAIVDLPSLLMPYFFKRKAASEDENDAALTPAAKLRVRSGKFLAGRCVTISMGLILGIYQLVVASQDQHGDFSMTAVYFVSLYCSARITWRAVVLYFLHVSDRHGVWTSRKLGVFQGIYSIAQIVYIRSFCGVAGGHPSVSTEIATMTLTIISEFLLAIYAIYWIAQTFKNRGWTNGSTSSKRLRRKRRVHLEEWLGGCLIVCYFAVYVIGACIAGGSEIEDVLLKSQNFGIISADHFGAFIYLSAFLVAAFTILPATCIRAEWSDLQVR